MNYQFAAYDHEFRFAGLVQAANLAGAIAAAKARGVLFPMVERATKEHLKLRVCILYT